MFVLEVLMDALGVFRFDNRRADEGGCGRSATQRSGSHRPGNAPGDKSLDKDSESFGVAAHQPGAARS